MNRPKPIYEFLLWANCNNHCKFCFQQHQGQKDTFLSDEQKIESIQSERNFIASKDYIFGSHVLIVGGEIFGGFSSAKLSIEFENFLDFLIKRMVVGKIDLLYINTNLIYSNTDSLIKFLDKIDSTNLFSRLKFTTSYDISGRFSNEQDRNMMLTNLQSLIERYRGRIKVVTNMILTKQMCDSIQNDIDLTNPEIRNDKGSVAGFMDKFQCNVNTVPYIILDEELAATRADIISSLEHTDRFIPGYFKSYVDNFNLDQDKLLYEYHAGEVNKLVFCSTENAPCGHSINFNRYQTDRKTCFVCDMLKAYKEYENANK